MRQADPHHDPANDNVSKNIKSALNALKEHPTRVFDRQSALDVKGIGPSIANVSVYFQGP